LIIGQIRLKLFDFVYSTRTYRNICFLVQIKS
jgi:hypothetical protein